MGEEEYRSLGEEEDRRFEHNLCTTALMREYAQNFNTRRMERIGDALHIHTFPDMVNDHPAREIIVHLTVTITEAE